MPTGYTAAVVDGSLTELEPFIWQLARGMGALITMRDDPHDAPIPERFEPSDYNAKRLSEAQAERDRLYAMTDFDCEVAARMEATAYDERVAKHRAEKAEQRQRYQSMIDKVRAWQGAPEGIKEFGLEQLARGMEFDCPEPFTWYEDRPSEDGSVWRSGKLAKVARDIEYHSAEDAKERARVDGRNAWLAQLRRSLAKAEA